MGKNTMVRIAALVCMASLLVGCNLVRVNPEKDRQLVIATVNGEDVLKGEFLDQYAEVKYYSGISEEVENDPTYKEYIDQVKESILDDLIIAKIVGQKAEAAGYTVTEEDLIKAREDAIADWAGYLKSLDESQELEVLTQEEYEQKAIESLQQMADDRLMTVEDVIRQQAIGEKTQAFRGETLSDVVATPGEVENYYQENLAGQQADITTIPSADVVLYHTEGAKVHYIRLEMDGEQQAEYDRLAGDNDGAAASYLENELYARAEALKDEAADSEWEAMEEKYEEDEQVYFISSSFDMRRGGNWDDAIVDSLVELEAGDIADPIQNNRMYYIFFVDEPLRETVYTLAEKEEEIQEFLDQQKQDEKWTELTGQWKEESTIKTYKGRLK